MEWEYTLRIDRKFIVAFFLVALALGGGFSLVYWSLKTSLNTLQDKYTNLSNQLKTLQGLIEQLYYGQKLNLTAVQIYNMTRNSVVLVVAGNKSGSGFIYNWTNGKGYIVTNYHVIEGYENDVKVTFFIDGKPIQTVVTVKGKDIYSDLTVLEVHDPPEKAK
ncbi:MAG: serine protease, partial [Candidatus Bathyarchaeia archaeon]